MECSEPLDNELHLRIRVHDSPHAKGGQRVITRCARDGDASDSLHVVEDMTEIEEYTDDTMLEIDILVHLEDLDLLFAAWQAYPRRIVGFFPRFHSTSRRAGGALRPHRVRQRDGAAQCARAAGGQFRSLLGARRRARPRLLRERRDRDVRGAERVLGRMLPGDVAHDAGFPESDEPLPYEPR
jgi:hypothetical protein